ncbi:acyl-CoA dehydrogenase family protein [Methylobacterium sp.]|uniref:acyl-CoA dehydrogenase family protein n=1 Tax=Methylobacterium sp. TaxID=409 RepID=UPI0025E451F2|nr:acyl-CoA dehydrogenase family protein [Methylobacterium sp.]
MNVVVPQHGMHGSERLKSAARAVSSLAASRADRLDREGEFPAEDVADCHRLGLLAAPLPHGLGGSSLNEAGMAPLLLDVLALLGRGSLALGRLYEGHVNALSLVSRYASTPVRERLAGDAMDGHLFGVWNTQSAEGGLVLSEEGVRYRLSGSKSFASGAGFVTRPLVTARRPDGRQQMLVVDLGQGERADLSSWRAQGMRASVSGTVDFSELCVGPEAFIGDPDDYFREPDFSGGAWRFCAVQLGGIEAVFDTLRQHLRETRRDGDAHQRGRVGQAAIAVETARLVVARAASIANDPNVHTDQAIAYVNLARSSVERAGLDVLEHAQRSIGLAGFLQGHPIERLSRDLMVYLRQPGPDRALDMAAGYVLARSGPADSLWH